MEEISLWYRRDEIWRLERSEKITAFAERYQLTETEAKALVNEFHGWYYGVIHLYALGQRHKYNVG